MTKFAANTTVAVSKSKMEIENILCKYGATGFMSGWNSEKAMIAFEMCQRRIVFNVPMPNINSDDIRLDGRGRIRDDSQIEKAYDQAQRQRWRALLLVLKAKLEAVESGITEFEDEFLAHIALPDGSTAGEWMKPQIAIAYKSNTMPALLPAPGDHKLN